MTGKERLNNILDKKLGNELAWTSFIDQVTRAGMSEEVKKMSILEINKLAGLDTMQFGNYGLGQELGIPCPFKFVTPGVREEDIQGPDGTLKKITTTEWGTLTASFSHGHPTKYPVETIEDFRVYKNILQNTYCQEDTSDNYETGSQRVNGIIGDDGIYCSTIPESPVQHLLQYKMGVENFNYLLMDHPEEMEELLDIMHQLKCHELEILCRRSSAKCVIPVENTSTAMISPQQYEKYSVRQMRDYADIIHKHGKLAIWHMCGHLKSLLPLIKETGLDGINAVTPPPLGNTHFSDVFDVLGDDFIILGGVIDTAIFQKVGVTHRELWKLLDEIYTAELRAANFLLHIPAGAIPLPLERFHMIRDWFENNR